MLLAGCAPQLLSSGSRGACAETQNALGLDQTSGGLSGEYRLTLIAQGGPRRGHTVTGLLTLIPTDTSDRSPDPRFSQIRPVRYVEGFMPYYGHARLELQAVGAGAEKDITSTDPIYPGAVLTDYRATDPNSHRPWREVEISLGGANNRRDGTVVTGWGTSTTLHIREISRGGFRGSWHSGDEHRVRGFFCADREQT